MLNKNTYFLLVLIIFLQGCMSTLESLNDALYADPLKSKNGFDGTHEVYLEPVAAYNYNDSHQNFLGLHWTEKTPNYVVITAGIKGIDNIRSISFNIDGNIYNVTQSIDAITDFKTNRYSSDVARSFRKFKIPINLLIKLTQADTVKYKVTLLDNTYTLSTFGRSYSESPISSRLIKFLELKNTI